MPELNLSPNALGFNTLLLGMPGAGKTTAIATLLKSGLEVFVAFTEQGVGNLKKGLKVHGCTEEEISRLHWAYISPSRSSFGSLLKSSKDILVAPEFGKMPAGNRKDYDQFIQLLGIMNDFVDQNGESFGAVDEWDASRVLVLDGLSGLNDMCMGMVAGGKPVKTLQDWGVAIDALDKYIKQLCNCTCSFILLSHLEQEKDEITGRMIVTASALGRKLGATIGRHFQDVILAERNGKDFRWATDSSRVELKYSFLKNSASLPPTFEPLVESWAEENSNV